MSVLYSQNLKFSPLYAAGPLGIRSNGPTGQSAPSMGAYYAMNLLETLLSVAFSLKNEVEISGLRHLNKDFCVTNKIIIG